MTPTMENQEERASKMNNPYHVMQGLGIGIGFKA